MLEVVNARGDGKLYNIIINYGLEFEVYANCTEEALETLGQYCKDQNYTGLIENRSYNELLEECDEDEDILNERYYPINGGEFYLSTYALDIIDAN